MSGLRVTVTGGAGFIGSTVVSRLVRHAAVGQVTVIDDCSTGSPAMLGDDRAHVDFRRGSILDPDAIDAAAFRADVIVHLAALGSVPRSISDPVATHHANVTGTVHVLQAARAAGCSLLVTASSSSVYGSQPTVPRTEDSCPLPVSPYGASKLAGEAYVRAFAQTYELPALPLRLFNVYGPRQRADHPYAAVVPRLCRAALTGQEFTVHGDGHQSRDFTFVDVVCDVIEDALVRRVTSDPVNVGFGSATSVLDLVTVVGELLGAPVAVRHAASRAGDVRNSPADPTRFRALFPTVRPTDLRAGLAETLEWHRRHHSDGRGTAALSAGDR
ncbi:NAD-dependent epimerase/dehydratase family protein [Nocardia xishanensis]|uniref:NAD-dependent epimerase/dehydratase family protein n=1 Tax=Nocardia xishanensis TaxID=238964 RepID=A0ABW7WW76_9NOCA